ncbi:MAG: carboxypeptidase-like regulatory domain-containing protein [Bacteroidales bacterium]|nr:carboxypeptidase-like regulatory domain-containing protein [Bacteroidales bacterium]MCF8326837.1 carboxypeptidase-like regulatory domain-containing protein [Bacteroidales bacterium]
MKKYSLLVFSCLLLLGFSSCEKDEQNITVEGKVINTNTGNGVSDATVILDNKPVSSSVYNAGYQKLVSATTSSDGSYQLQYEKERSSDYRITVRKDSYIPFREEYAPDVFEAEQQVNMSFNLASKGYIKTEINNVSSYNENDHIVLRFLDAGQYECIDCCPSEYIHGYGQYFDTTFVCIAPGGDYYSYEYNVTINNSTNLYGPDSVYIEPFDTTKITIEY